MNLVDMLGHVFQQAGMSIGQRLDKGGPGSGNFGHAGRPGEVGGSAPADGGDGKEADANQPPPDALRTAEEKAKRQERRRAQRAAERGEKAPEGKEAEVDTSGAFAPGTFYQKRTSTEAVEWASKVYPNLHWNSVEALDPKIVNQFVNGVDRVLSKNSYMSSAVGSITVVPAADMKTKGALAETIFDPDTGQSRIVINEEEFSDLDALGVSLRVGPLTGWSPVGCDTAEYVMVHELGHALQSQSFRSQGVTREGVVGTDGMGEVGNTMILWTEYMFEHSTSPSLYGSSNYNEFFAESFASYYFTPEARQEKSAKYIGALLSAIDPKNNADPASTRKASEATSEEDERFINHIAAALARKLGMHP